MNSETRIASGLVTTCFFVSGAAGLIYQVAWSRYLALLLGHTSYAVVAVVAAFMAGLAIGNAWFGRRADRAIKPLALYAWLEIGIGVYAILFPAYFSICQDAFIGVARRIQPGSDAFLALKFAFSLAMVLVPTILMGATFPVLTRYVTDSLGNLRHQVASLYAVNSAGAVFGCLIADFWWVPQIGLEMTVFGAGGLNLAAGLIALVLSLRGHERAPGQGEASITRAQEEEKYEPSQVQFAIVAVGISGFVAMLYEIAWTRLLGLVLGSTTHAFSLMLATFITGIAIGALVLSRWGGLRRTWAAFGWAEVILAASLLISMFFYQYLSFWFIQLAGLLARREQAYPLYQLLQGILCFSVMIVPTICLGMTLPLASRIATTELSATGRAVGLVFAVNTIGTVLGTALTGLWLMPRLGLARTFAVGIALSAMLGLLVLTWHRLAGRRQGLILPFLGTVLLVWLASSHLDGIWQRAFSLGIWRAPNPPRTLAAFSRTVSDIPLAFHKDGASATVDVYSWKDETEEHLTLKVNGKADAGIQTDMITQLLLGHLPMLLRPAASQVLVIGLGSGITCGAVAEHPTLDRMDAVEISPEVIQAARLFSKHNGGVLDNPKLHIAVEDAKAFLQTTRRKYDLIISEPSNPWMAGVAAVFSREYYDSCAARLNRGGLIAQWMHVYEMTDQTIDVVLRTFLSSFPNMSIWQPAQGDLILIGSREPFAVDLQQTAQRFGQPAVRKDLARAQLLTLPALLAHEIVPQQNGLFMVEEGPVHSDFLPTLEYRAQRDLFLNQVAERWRQYREDFSPRAGTLLGQYLQKEALSSEDFSALVLDYRKHRMPEARLFRSLLLQWQSHATNAALATDLWGLASDRPSTAETRAVRMAPWRSTMLEEAASNPQPLRLYSLDLMQAYRQERSIFYLPTATNLESILVRLVEVDAAHRRVHHLHLAELAWDRGEDARCLELGQRALDPDSTKAGPVDYSLDEAAPKAVLYRMTETFLRQGKLAEARAVCESAKASGYLQDAESSFPLLQMTYRKVQAYVAVQSAAGRNSAPR